ncbi:MAG: sucrase ferredoxin [Acidimicrobiales bacterium]
MPDPVCSAVSMAYDEPLQATASIVRNWLLVEHPGAWGPAALTESGLPPAVATGLDERARRHGFRVLLLRRPERPSDGSRQCFVAHSGRHRRWIEQRVVDDIAELLDVDFSPLLDGEPVGFGTPRDAPLYLVCTNGRHDQCCANLGRPVARALHARADEAVWESSHYGGDRFAGNLVCLPHGMYFGRLSPVDAQRVVEAYERGVIDLDTYRGRSGEPFAAQAAEHFLRRQEALLGVDDLVVSGYQRHEQGVVEVRFDGPNGRAYDVRVQVRPALEPRPLSCGAGTEGRPPTYALIGVNGR